MWIRTDQKLRSLLEQACASAENQACWDKKPWSEWYYEAKKYLNATKPLRQSLVSEEDIGGGYVVRTYELDPPQSRMQPNLNAILGPQTHVTRIIKIGGEDEG